MADNNNKARSASEQTSTPTANDLECQKLHLPVNVSNVVKTVGVFRAFTMATLAGILMRMGMHTYKKLMLAFGA